MSEPKEPFWIVVCDYRNAVGESEAIRQLRPAERPHRHDTERSAIAEAMRLTRACRTQSFYVFKVVVGIHPPLDIRFENFKDAENFDDQIPF